MAIGLPIPSRTAPKSNAPCGLPIISRIAAAEASGDLCTGTLFEHGIIGAVESSPMSAYSSRLLSPEVGFPRSPEPNRKRKTVCRRRMIPKYFGNDILQQKYEIAEDKLGEGGFGVVRRARLRAGGPVRAIKSVSKRSHAASYLGKREIEILRRLDHPCICRLIESFEDDSYIYLVLEYIEGRELFDEIVEQKVLDQTYAANIMRQIFGALHYCHGQSPAVIHRDLKPENIMIQTSSEDDGKGTEINHHVKLIDFGLAVMCPLMLQADLVGSKDYIAPESLAKGTYSPASDLWSAGVVLHTLLCGSLPCHYADLDLLLSGSTVSILARQLVQDLLKFNPSERLTASQAIIHPWVRDSASNVPSQSTSGLLMSSFLGFHRSQKLRRAALTAVAMQLSDDHLQEIREQFLLIDLDCDGKISRDELIRWVSSGVPGRSSDVRIWAEKVFESIDTDGSGCIEFSEWAAAAIQSNACDNAVEAAFRVFDSDNDGQIRVGEIGHLFNLSDREVQRYVRQYDLNGDGMIDYSEFKTMLRSEPKFSPPPSACPTPHYPSAQPALLTPVFPCASPMNGRGPPLADWLLELSQRHPNGSPTHTPTTPASARLSAALRLKSPMWAPSQPLRHLPGAAHHPQPTIDEQCSLSPFSCLFEDSERSAMLLESPEEDRAERRRSAIEVLHQGAMGLQLDFFDEDE